MIGKILKNLKKKNQVLRTIQLCQDVLDTGPETWQGKGGVLPLLKIASQFSHGRALTKFMEIAPQNATDAER